jgi:S-ribosylhomocysteine lyase LuxS involved in autoinducer biosynthesis
MPSEEGLRIDDFHRVQHLRSQAIESRKHQAIDVSDGDPLGRSTPQHIELMAKDENFGCNAARDRNTPATAYQINLSSVRRTGEEDDRMI